MPPTSARMPPIRSSILLPRDDVGLHLLVLLLGQRRGLASSRFGTVILPTSWSRAPNSTSRRSRSSMPRCARRRSIGRTTTPPAVAAGVLVVGLDQLAEQERGAAVGVAELERCRSSPAAPARRSPAGRPAASPAGRRAALAAAKAASRPTGPAARRPRDRDSSLVYWRTAREAAPADRGQTRPSIAELGGEERAGRSASRPLRQSGTEQATSTSAGPMLYQASPRRTRCG